ncbi:MAG: LLM class flavin-dependent oxidoreductase [Candidatus Aenigmarchaeota archaeon]|nr:LLM class flavin-dependent oxidoreductase [Candidatus Aenigmarchaeota archaeon]MDW7997999.1 LLM class flavin-dependent oxidoreductase [Thermodesulfovibrio sp.]MDW8149189.1 LLM class flavin-dependent oxidoreductase [Candidatus Aenigmarchaeota archaeon]
MKKKNIQFGLVIPQELGYSVDYIVKAACEAERLGFDSVWIYDHFFMDPKKQYPECFVTLTAIACNTKKITFGPLVLNNLFRHPSLVAKIGATLDQISKGRFRLGIGAGWYYDECKAFGINFPSFKERIEMLAESVEVIMKLWNSRGKRVSYSGKYYKINEAVCLPPTYQVPNPPCFVGGKSIPLLQIVAKNSIGINIDQDWGIGLGEAQKILSSLQYLCHQQGTNFDKIDKSLCIRIFVGCEKEVEEQKKKLAKSQVIDYYTKTILESIRFIRSFSLPEELKVTSSTSQVVGSPEDCRKQIEDYINLGFTEFYFKVYDYTDFELLELISKEIVKPMKRDKT